MEWPHLLDLAGLLYKRVGDGVGVGRTSRAHRGLCACGEVSPGYSAHSSCTCLPATGGSMGRDEGVTRVSESLYLNVKYPREGLHRNLISNHWECGRFLLCEIYSLVDLLH